MTDDLIARLRIVPLHSGFGSTCHAAADALEAKAARIAELERNCIVPQEREIKRLCARIVELTAALRPFIEAGALKHTANTGTLYEHTVWNICVSERDLRAARAALEKKP